MSQHPGRASTNHETSEQLKFVRDSGGNIVQHFPPEDDPRAHRALKGRVANLDMLVDDEASGQHLVATSVRNLVRLCKPPVILDEGHKATSSLARSTIEGFNASVVVELSATPKAVKIEGQTVHPNIISRVSGQELLDEEMIKLPLNIATSGRKDWKDVLTQARDRREFLSQKSAEFANAAGPDRLIRPIVLVQVERTGKDQRGPEHIHSEDVREYLTSRLDVAPSAIAVKTAETDAIENINLLDPSCPIEWIITRSALQEGWDCPFAYILVSLNNTGSATAMTQLVGRILRQPNQERTKVQELDESYVYCLHTTAGEIAAQVKGALEREGYEGEIAGLVVDERQKAARNVRPARVRDEFASLYRKPFAGKIYLPRFCVKTADGYERLDYFRHLLSRVDVADFSYGNVDWHLADALREAKDRFYTITLGQGLTPERETEAQLWERDAQVLAWMAASLSFDYLSHKQIARVVRGAYERLIDRELVLNGRLALVKFVVRDKLTDFIHSNVDRQTEAAFGKLYDSGRLKFYLECAECRFLVPPEIEVKATRPLMHDDGQHLERSLFDFIPDDAINGYERAVALCIDRNEKVLWWFRNMVGEENFSIQGYRRPRIYPDFIVQSGTRHKPEHRVIVVETKGPQLIGSADTEYKRKVADYFERVGKRVTWQQLSEEFHEHIFRFQILGESGEDGRDWRDALGELLGKEA